MPSNYHSGLTITGLTIILVKENVKIKKLIKLIKPIWCDNFKIYEYPRIATVLRKQGIKISNRRVYRLMHIHIRSLMNQRFHKPNTHVDYAQRPNLIKHINHETNTIWRTDITYLKLNADTWVYLSSIYEQTKKVISAIVDRNTQVLNSKEYYQLITSNIHILSKDIRMITNQSKIFIQF